MISIRKPLLRQMDSKRPRHGGGGGHSFSRLRSLDVLRFCVRRHEEVDLHRLLRVTTIPKTPDAMPPCRALEVPTTRQCTHAPTWFPETAKQAGCLRLGPDISALNGASSATLDLQESTEQTEVSKVLTRPLCALKQRNPHSRRAPFCCGSA